MAVQLFRLRGVSEQETEEILALLTEHGIDYYLTPAGNWGISMPAIWLDDESQLDRAKQLIDTYQQQRYQRARQDYEDARRHGRQRRLRDVFRESPTVFIIYLLAILIVLFFATLPFIFIGN